MKYLIIDDEIYARKALAKRIQSIAGEDEAEIYEAEDVPTAKIILQKIHFDIIFLDIYMPGENGLDLAEYLMQSSLTYEIVVVSGYAEFEYAQKALELGVRHYLLKPVNEDKLRKILKESFEKNQDSPPNSLVLSSEEMCRLVFGEGLTQIPFEEGYLVIDIQGNADLNDKICMKITGALSRIFKRRIGYTVNPMRLSEFVAVCKMEKEAGEEIRRQLEPVLECGETLCIGVSNLYKRAEDAAKAYHEALDALNNRLIDRWNKIFLYSEETIVPLNENEFQTFSQALEKQEYTVAYAAVSRMLYSVLDENCRFSQIRYIYQRVANCIYDYKFEHLKESRSMLIRSVNSFHSIKEILDYFQELLGNMASAVPKSSENAMQDVVDYIHQYYYDFISLEALARERYYMNAKYFGKLFREYTGMSFSKYLAKVRMEKAVEYLEDGNYNIQQVSYMCGYTNVSHFIQTFKKYYNETPAKWKGGEK